MATGAANGKKTSVPIVLAALAVVLGLLAPSPARAAPPPPGTSTAFFYGPHVPAELFAHFDRVVADPDHLPAPPAGTRANAFAYVSLGEVNPSRAWAKDVPRKLLLAKNGAFGSDVIDVASPDWARFVLERVIEPLYGAGYRGFFFDTLDSWQLTRPTPAHAAAHVQGLVAILRALKQRHGDAQILLNRGFELLPAAAPLVSGVVAESLLESYDHGARRYRARTAAETAALKARLDEVKTKYGLPVSVIDYVPAAAGAKRVETAKRILELGYEPWVSGPALDEVGVGRARVLPRKVLLLYAPGDTFLGDQDACKLVAPVIEHYGYVPEYLDVTRPLPEGDLAGRVAGIVVYVPAPGASEPAVRRWVTRQLDAGIRVAFLHGFGFNPSPSLIERLGLAPASENARAPMTVAATSPMLGLETPVKPRLLDRPPVRVARADVTSLLRLEDADKNVWDGVVVGPWGGVAFDPYVLHEGLGEIRRWVLDPFKFVEAALALPPIPVPDVTTEGGRRIFTSHIDGDAFYSRAEKRGNPFTAQLILDEILARYRVPHTVSVIEGEIGPEGIVMRPTPGKPYPDPTIKTVEQRREKVEQLEAIARKIFKLPHVELATHTYSHPFFWEEAEAHKERSATEPVHLQIDGYTFDLARDIKGSIEYINTRLAPPDKRVKLVLWSGSCSPSKEAVALTQQLGVLNVNGGGATRVHDLPTLTRGSPMGIPKGEGAYQVFAPIENENVYTNYFRGPYYGFRRVIDTFELTESPRRLSILSIYYHFYSAAKSAALVALKDVYDYAMKQETTPLYLSEYATKVLAFQRVSVAQRIDGGGWELGELGDLRTVRLPPALGWPDMVRSKGVAGVRDAAPGRYVTLARDARTVELALAPQAPEVPYVESVNGRVLAWSRGEGRPTNVQLEGNVPLVVTIAGTARSCTLRGAFGTARATRSGRGQRFTLTATSTGDAILDCP